VIYVMSDVHGYDIRYKDILRQIKLKGDDHLYILGDVIDRYPGGLRVLRDTMKRPNVTLLLGNHEHMMRKALSESGTLQDMDRWYWNGGDITHRAFKYCGKEYRTAILDYIASLPLNVEVTVNGTDYLLVHGAPAETFAPRTSSFDDQTMHAVWSRINASDPLPEGKTVIFGHTPTKKYGSRFPMRIYHGDHRIGIDCGCAYGSIGRLACLRLDDMKEYYSNAEWR